ncbi:hypothetical protein ZIOFF_029933 [Zingiber officinale]|uniref:Late embryogenesis abundant protein LEA-2 subgroup domain-containing protein n=1 Tax=Zingiber officinale TaxID=94328 RepID=A0A8J5L4J2_ZINOF|nr:hypothetical protein ZIOFF_029933 [Zingiber officinale]
MAATGALLVTKRTAGDTRRASAVEERQGAAVPLFLGVGGCSSFLMVTRPVVGWLPLDGGTASGRGNGSSPYLLIYTVISSCIAIRINILIPCCKLGSLDSSITMQYRPPPGSHSSSSTTTTANIQLQQPPERADIKFEGLQADRPTPPAMWLVAALCTLLWLAVILGGLAVLIVYLVFRPRTPLLEIVSGTLNGAYLDVGPRLNVDLTLLVNISNPNAKVHVTLSYLQLDLYFDGVLLATQGVEPLEESAGEAVLRSVHMVVSEVVLGTKAAEKWQEEAQGGGTGTNKGVGMQVVGRFRSRSVLSGWMRYSYWLHRRCNILPISQGKPRPLLCIVAFHLSSPHADPLPISLCAAADRHDPTPVANHLISSRHKPSTPGPLFGSLAPDPPLTECLFPDPRRHLYTGLVFGRVKAVGCVEAAIV